MPKFIWSFLLYINILCPLFLFGQNRDSISALNKAEELINKAGALYGEGMLTEALDTLKESLNIKIKLYGDINPELANTYRRFGVLSRSMGNLNEALEFYQLAEDCYLRSENVNPLIISNLYLGMANVYRNKLDYNKSLQYFEQSLSELYKIPDIEKARISKQKL